MAGIILLCPHIAIRYPMFMTCCAIVAALAASVGLAAQPVSPSAPAHLPLPGVVIFWASWCGPCHAELARLPVLAAAARPLPIALLALDTPEVAKAALRGRVPGIAAFADGRPPATILSEWGGTTLPLAVALDRSGRRCGAKAGLLGTDQLRDWAARCSR